MSASEISAPRWRFLDGLCKTQGYNVVTEGERVTVAFEPWALEQVDPFDIPCLRLEFRQVDGRIVLERFTIENDGQDQVVNLEAARDALQAWMDSMADERILLADAPARGLSRQWNRVHAWGMSRA